MPALTEALSNENEWGFRREAAYALGEIGGGRAVSALVEMLKDKNENEWVRTGAAWALGKIGDERAVSILIEALDDEVVHEKAVSVLRNIGTPEALEAVEKYKKQNNLNSRERLKQGINR